MKSVHHSYWNIVNLAHVARVMLFLYRDTQAGNGTAKQDLSRAKDLFSQMVGGVYERDEERRGFMHKRIALLMIVLSSADPYWARFCSQLLELRNWYAFALTTKAFNLVLEGIVEAHGSVTGRRVLDLFWHNRIRALPNADRRDGQEAVEEQIDVWFSPLRNDSLVRKRAVVKIPGHPKEKIPIYGGLVPDLMTINIILRKALEESQQGSKLLDWNEEPELESSFTPSSSISYVPFEGEKQLAAMLQHPASGCIVWAICCLRSILMDDDGIRDELSNTLSKYNLDDVRAQLSRFFEKADKMRRS
jgi:hypothetical protein